MKPISTQSFRRFAAHPWLIAALSTTAAVAQAAGPSLFIEQTPLDQVPARAFVEHAAQARLNPQALNAQQVRWRLPSGAEVVVNRKTEVRGARGERTWLGEFKGQPGSLLSLTSYKGFVSGFAHLGADTWEFEGLGNGRSRVFKVDESRLPPEGPNPHIATAGETSTTSSSTAPSTAASVITQDVLLLYTPAAALANGGTAAMETKALNAVAAANSAYANSGVNAQLNVVGIRQIAYTESGDMGQALSRLAAASDGFMDEAHTWRNEVGADLVALMTTDSNYCGIAYVMQGGASAGFAPYAFSVTAPGCLAGHTLAHEIGHNQGNAHDRVTGGSGAYPYSYGYRTCDYPDLANGQSFRTVMAYSCASTPRVNQFSNPQVLFNNAAPMGISYELDPARSADNARSMNNTAATIAGFRAGPAGLPPAAPSGLQALATAYDRVQLNWVDNASNEAGFVVQRATNGGSYTDRATLASNVTAFLDTGLAGNTSYSYRVRAYNSAGASAYTLDATVATPAAPPAPVAPSPAQLTLTGSNAAITWANVANETGYEVLRETYNARKASWSGSVFTVPADVTLLTQTLAAGTYRYSVRAVGAGGVSSPAIVACSTCGPDGAFAVSATKNTGKR